jgi:hypothetical protein
MGALMSRRAVDEDEWDDGDEDGGDEDDATDDEEDEEDGEPTVPCPYCRREIHEDAQRCPYCENYISQEDAPPTRKPWWIIIGILLALYAVYRWVGG